MTGFHGVFPEPSWCQASSIIRTLWSSGFRQDRLGITSRYPLVWPAPETAIPVEPGRGLVEISSQEIRFDLHLPPKELAPRIESFSQQDKDSGRRYVFVDHV